MPVWRRYMWSRGRNWTNLTRNMFADDIRDGCTFTWKIENFSQCLERKERVFKSPPVFVHSLEKTEWSLSLYPKAHDGGEFIGVNLTRSQNDEGPEVVLLDCELAFLGPDGSPLVYGGVKEHEFTKSNSFGYSGFISRERVFELQRIDFLPLNVLTVRCRLWKSGEDDLEEAENYFLHTKIE